MSTSSPAPGHGSEPAPGGPAGPAGPASGGPPPAWTPHTCTQAWQAFAASTESAGSPVADLAQAAAADPVLMAKVSEEGDVLPNLWLAAIRLRGGSLTVGYRAWRDWLIEHWTTVTAVLRQRAVQTNEVNRCSYLMPALAQIARQHQRPVAVIEFGASAGLLLNLARYRYAYDIGGVTTSVGPADSPVTVSCTATGDVPIPPELPRLGLRVGLDLHPLEASNDADTAWLTNIGTWPGQDERRDRLFNALVIAREDPPVVMRGGLDRLRAVAEVADGMPLVVIDVGVARYLAPEQRAIYAHTVRDVLGAHHICADMPAHLPLPLRPGQLDGWPDPPDPLTFVIMIDGQPVAQTDPNGHHLYWHDGSPRAHA